MIYSSSSLDSTTAFLAGLTCFLGAGFSSDSSSESTTFLTGAFTALTGAATFLTGFSDDSSSESLAILATGFLTTAEVLAGAIIGDLALATTFFWGFYYEDY